MTVAFVSASAWFDGATGLTADKVLTLPSHSTGDLILVLAAWKDFAITAQISGYTEITEFASGSVATGNGSGSMKVAAWYKVAASGAESNPTLDFSTTTGLVGEACVLVFSQSAGTWATPAFGTNVWASNITGTISSSTSHTIPDGGAVVALFGISDDSATFTRPTDGMGAIGGGITWNGNYIEAPATHASTTTGNDMAADAGYRLVTTGAAAKNPSTTITSLSAAETGAVLFIILGDVSAGTTVTPTTAALVITKNIPTVTVSNNQRVTPTTAALVATKYAPTIRLGQVVTVPTAGGAGYAAAVLADSPVGYWRMGEASGSVLDSIGSSHGTATGTTRDVIGALAGSQDDGAITFNGTSDKVRMGDVLDQTGAVSYELWLKRANTTAALQYVMNKGNHQPNIIIKADHYLNVGEENVDLINSSTAILNNTAWHHIVFTWTGAASAGAVKLYVDGADVGVEGTPAAISANSSSLSLGAAYVDALWFAGTIDEAAIYNTVLSPTRVLAHYNAGITAGGLVLTTYAPTIRQGVGVIPTTKALTLATFAPSVRTPILATPTTKAVVLTKYAPTVSTPVRATPSTVSLTATRFAPTIYLHQRVIPTTKALVATKYAPTVTTPERVTPTTKALALAAFAPVVTVTSAQSVVPITAALLLGEQVPTVTATAHQRVTPTTASLVLTKNAPTVTAGADVAVIPGTASVTTTKYAPTVTAAQHVTVTPITKALTTASFVPAATISNHQRVTPTTKALVATKYAPSVRTPILATPTTRALTATKFAPQARTPQTFTPAKRSLVTATFVPTITNPQRYVPTTAVLVTTKYAPTISVTAASTIVVPNKSLTITRHIPNVSATAHLAVTPPAVALTVTKYAPTVSSSAHQVVTPGVKSLTATRFAPTVTSGANVEVVPNTRTLALTKFAPTVSASADVVVIPATKVVQLNAFAPTARVANLVRPATKALVLTTLAPIVTPTLNTLVRPNPNHLTVTRFAPHLDISGHAAFEPITTALLLTTYAPTAETHSITPLPYPIYGFAVVAMGDSAGVGVENGGATVRSEGGGTAVLTSGPSARVTIR